MSERILYSFRRCPYAIRARMTLAYTQSDVELREVVLKHKPSCMLALSAKGTVPVLKLEDGQVLDESLDIMLWSLENADPEGWLPTNDQAKSEAEALIKENDGYFKHYLDRYKYSVGYPEHPESYYREKAEVFLVALEERLTKHSFLLGNTISYADIAIFPFIRQFAFVDKNWFDRAPYPKLQHWLEHFLQSELFLNVMTKFAAWQDGDRPVIFPAPVSKA